jgi:hypothetical protein
MVQMILPSGMVGEVRKIKGTEIAAIAEQADGAETSDGGFGPMLNGCWLNTVDPGPYRFLTAGDSKPPWSRVLKGDLLFGLVFLRRISLTDGDDFDFDAHCEECRKKIPWSVRLSDVPLRALSAESRKRLTDGQPFETTAAGVKVTYDLQTLDQEPAIKKLMKQMKRTRSTLVDLIFGQVRTIEGVPNDPRKRYQFLADLSMGELQDLQATMEESDCGFETEIEVKCQNEACQWEQPVNLPLLNRRFFSPKKRQKVMKEEPEEEPKQAALAFGVASSEG